MTGIMPGDPRKRKKPALAFAFFAAAPMKPQAPKLPAAAPVKPPAPVIR